MKTTIYHTRRARERLPTGGGSRIRAFMPLFRERDINVVESCARVTTTERARVRHAHANVAT